VTAPTNSRSNLFIYDERDRSHCANYGKCSMCYFQAGGRSWFADIPAPNQDLTGLKCDERHQLYLDLKLDCDSPNE